LGRHRIADARDAGQFGPAYHTAISTDGNTGFYAHFPLTPEGRLAVTMPDGSIERRSPAEIAALMITKGRLDRARQIVQFLTVPTPAQRAVFEQEMAQLRVVLGKDVHHIGVGDKPVFDATRRRFRAATDEAQPRPSAWRRATSARPRPALGSDITLPGLEGALVVGEHVHDLGNALVIDDFAHTYGEHAASLRDVDAGDDVLTVLTPVQGGSPVARRPKDAAQVSAQAAAEDVANRRLTPAAYDGLLRKMGVPDGRKVRITAIAVDGPIDTTALLAWGQELAELRGAQVLVGDRQIEPPPPYAELSEPPSAPSMPPPPYTDSDRRGELRVASDTIGESHVEQFNRLVVFDTPQAINAVRTRYEELTTETGLPSVMLVVDISGRPVGVRPADGTNGYLTPRWVAGMLAGAGLPEGIPLRLLPEYFDPADPVVDWAAFREWAKQLAIHLGRRVYYGEDLVYDPDLADYTAHDWPPVDWLPSTEDLPGYTPVVEYVRDAVSGQLVALGAPTDEAGRAAVEWERRGVALGRLTKTSITEGGQTRGLAFPVHDTVPATVPAGFDDYFVVRATGAADTLYAQDNPPGKTAGPQDVVAVPVDEMARAIKGGNHREGMKIVLAVPELHWRNPALSDSERYGQRLANLLGEVVLVPVSSELDLTPEVLDDPTKWHAYVPQRVAASASQDGSRLLSLGNRAVQRSLNRVMGPSAQPLAENAVRVFLAVYPDGRLGLTYEGEPGVRSLPVSDSTVAAFIHERVGDRPYVIEPIEIAGAPHPTAVARTQGRVRQMVDKLRLAPSERQRQFLDEQRLAPLTTPDVPNSFIDALITAAWPQLAAKLGSQPVTAATVREALNNHMGKTNQKQVAAAAELFGLQVNIITSRDTDPVLTAGPSGGKPIWLVHTTERVGEQNALAHHFVPVESLTASPRLPDVRVDRTGPGQAAHVWIGIEPDPLVTSKLNVPADYVVIHGRGVAGRLVDANDNPIDMRRVAALLGEMGLAGRKILLMACFSSLSARELADLRPADDPNAGVWGWPGPLWVSSSTGNAVGGRAQVTSTGHLIVSKPMPLRRYLPSGTQASEVAAEQSPLPTLTTGDLLNDTGKWSHRGLSDGSQDRQDTAAATIDEVLGGRVADGALTSLLEEVPRVRAQPLGAVSEQELLDAAEVVAWDSSGVPTLVRFRGPGDPADPVSVRPPGSVRTAVDIHGRGGKGYLGGREVSAATLNAVLTRLGVPGGQPLDLWACQAARGGPGALAYQLSRLRPGAPVGATADDVFVDARTGIALAGEATVLPDKTLHVRREGVFDEIVSGAAEDGRQCRPCRPARPPTPPAANGRSGWARCGTPRRTSSGGGWAGWAARRSAPTRTGTASSPRSAGPSRAGLAQRSPRPAPRPARRTRSPFRACGTSWPTS
jgi:hypothetical protein